MFVITDYSQRAVRAEDLFSAMAVAAEMAVTHDTNVSIASVQDDSVVAEIVWK